MNSITKAIPVFNTKTGIISYTWEDITQESPLCPYCGKSMTYWYSRKRGIIISDNKYIFMAPRFKCICGRTLTMRPYFIAPRKQYSIFSIQEILNADASHDRTVAVSCGSSEVASLRKWAVAIIKGLITDGSGISLSDERAVVREIYRCYGVCWLSSFLQNTKKCAPFSIPPQLSG